jgi:hypothetical protein
MLNVVIMKQLVKGTNHEMTQYVILLALIDPFTFPAALKHLLYLVRDRDRISHPHNPTDRIRSLYIYSLCFNTANRNIKDFELIIP